jgi:hypothetical protein
VRLFVESSEFAARDFSKALARACTATDAIIIEAATKVQLLGFRVKYQKKKNTPP